MTREAAGNANDLMKGRAEAHTRRVFRQAARDAGGSAGRVPTRDDNALAAALRAIANEVSQLFGMERAGINADFSARMRHARQHMQGSSVADIIRALKEQRSRALAELSRRTASAMKDRLAVARRRHLRAHPKPRGPQGPGG